MLAIIDYGVGNLYSLQSSLKSIGAEPVIVREPQRLRDADHIILPGVGAFEDARRRLRETGMDAAVLEAARDGRPLLGICLGMQLLFQRSFEYGNHEGLGLIPGQICPLAGDIRPGLKVPHIGWNGLNLFREDPLLRDFQNGAHVYYVHSYYAKNCEDHLLAVSEYDVAVPGLVRNENVYGAQFHPEKSGAAGLRLLKNFTDL
ncbi:MAG: imidazole glycerol phosphate synthase subunit HisH [Christensenellales bacterium]|nr:imidazole glycerol phosphate synthase subunit HisH [Christensenellales bacterium]